MTRIETKYVAITAVKNEEAYIEETLRSVASQTIRPSEWVIVDDGSTDSTAGIAETYSRRHRWITVVRLPGSERSRGGHVVELFYKGLSAVKTQEYRYIVKLDGDLSLEPDFFERAFHRFARTPSLGITSGISHVLSGGRLVEEKSAKGHTLGACKIYRKKCFDDIGGLVPAMGWDGIDEIKARMKGWDASPVEGLKVVHLRPEGRATGAFRSGVERGRGSYFMGYHPLFFALRAIRRAVSSPLDSAGMVAGYAGALLGSGERIDDGEFVRFLRINQIRKLLLMKSEV